jgi:agmatinase
MKPTFLNLPSRDTLAQLQADIAVLGVPHATPYRKGEASHAAAAPDVLRAALAPYAARLSHYDFDLGGPLLGDPSTAAAVVDCGDLPGDPADPPGNREGITKAVRAILAADAIPVILGGDDSVPIPVLQAYEGRGPLTIVQVDAHIDWRDEVDGERYGYSSTMRRASEMPWVQRMVQIGIRGVGSARPAEVSDAHAWGSHIITAREVHEQGIARVLNVVPSGANCFITFDCDALDPSIMPAVIGPSPGGLFYGQVVALLRGLAERTRIVGFDLVEFVPERDPGGLAALTAGRVVCNAVGVLARPTEHKESY